MPEIQPLTQTTKIPTGSREFAKHNIRTTCIRVEKTIKKLTACTASASKPLACTKSNENVANMQSQPQKPDTRNRRHLNLG